MRRVLVIGGTLFIGRALVRRLLARGDEVTILHRGRHNPFAGQAAEIHCDRNDVDAIEQALTDQNFDWIFDDVYDWERGTTAEHIKAAVLACAECVERYIFMSSVAAYGSGLDHDEGDPLAPEDFPNDYSRNKASSERFLLGIAADYDFPAVTLRPPFVYGPENPFYREAFFWDRLMADRPIVVPDDGSRLMQFVLVDDLARAAILAAEKRQSAGRAYNIANPKPVTQNEFVEALARAAGKPAKVVHLASETIEKLGGNVFEPPLYFGQYLHLPSITEKTSRARAELGFEATPFDQGLAAAFQWWSSQPKRPQPDFSFDDQMLAAAGEASDGLE